MIRKKSLFSSSTGLIKKRSLFLLILVTALLIMTSTALAEVTEISISPENPSPGDTVSVSGKASPNEEISVSIGFEKIQAVSDGSYEYHIGKITIPDGSESFSLRAEGVDSLDVTVYLLGIPITVPSNYVQVTNNVASFGTGKIKSGTYDIKLSGTSSTDEVTLSFGGQGSITADSNGNFQYSYTTENMPEGDFTLNVGGQTRQVSLGTTDDSSNSDSSSSSSTSSSSSSSTVKSSSNTGSRQIVSDKSLSSNASEGSSGVGDEVNTMASTTDETSASSESDTSSGKVDGYILENKSSSDVQSKLPELGVMGAVLGVLCLGAIFVGFRKNRYK